MGDAEHAAIQMPHLSPGTDVTSVISAREGI